MPRLIVLSVALVLPFAGMAAHAADCAGLTGLSLPKTQLISAVSVPAGTRIDQPFPGLPDPVELPAYCKLRGMTADAIGFEVWLPSDQWNHRLLSLGSGGFGGSLQLWAMADGLAKGYAVTANDTGHQGEDRAWMRDPVLVRHWGHDATHLVTAPAKAIVQAFYGEPAQHAYFAGCSTGGAQAMEEAEYFPADYDGIVAGAPGMSYARLMLSFLWGLKVATEHPDGVLPPAKLQILHRAVLEACDAADGVKDGLVGDPLSCRVDPRALICKSADSADCLSAEQAETARLIYQGPRNPRTGEQIYPGFPFGSEADPAEKSDSMFAYGWNGIQGPLAEKFAIPLLRDMVYQDPQWDWRRFDWDKDVADLDKRIGADITAVSPDLRGFAAHGGKLLMYQGWGDPLNAPLPVEYRAKVIDAFSQDKRGNESATKMVDGFYRLFMVPGMAHCIGGPGPSRFDSLAALREWVEGGHAPEFMVATRVAAMGRPMTPAFSRPVCPFPKSARWLGSGSVSDAANFRCQ